jgi:hypothetical protein
MGLFICFDCNEDSKIDDKNEERAKDNNQDIQISIRDLSLSSLREAVWLTGSKSAPCPFLQEETLICHQMPA